MAAGSEGGIWRRTRGGAVLGGAMNERSWRTDDESKREGWKRGGAASDRTDNGEPPSQRGLPSLSRRLRWVEHPWRTRRRRV